MFKVVLSLNVMGGSSGVVRILLVVDNPTDCV